MGAASEKMAFTNAMSNQIEAEFSD